MSIRRFILVSHYPVAVLDAPTSAAGARPEARVNGVRNTKGQVGVCCSPPRMAFRAT